MAQEYLLMFNVPNRTSIAVGALLAGILMLTLVALMLQMTRHMGRMTTEVASMAADMRQMRADMGRLADDVTGIRVSVSQMDALSRDVAGMRTSMEQLSGVVGSGAEQLQRLSPTNMTPGTMMQRMMPSEGSR
jgi:hypothetical protein